MKLFITPPTTLFHESDSGYYDNYIKELKEKYPDYKTSQVHESRKRTYSAYNYAGGGVVNGIKTQHFEKALRMTRTFFHKSKVLDLGCADGYFIPSLSAYFPQVVCADINEKHIRIAEKVIKQMKLNNVSAVCTEGNGLQKLIQEHTGYFDIIFLLETMEHIGTKEELYPSKLRFLHDISKMLSPSGHIVISVPVMTGPKFLLQRVGLWMLGMDREPMTFGEILRAGMLSDTDALEKRWWPHGHVGFNHNKLLNAISGAFRIVRRKKLLFQEMVLLRRK